jgi:hypothetical protein
MSAKMNAEVPSVPYLPPPAVPVPPQLLDAHPLPSVPVSAEKHVADCRPATSKYTDLILRSAKPMHHPLGQPETNEASDPSGPVVSIVFIVFIVLLLPIRLTPFGPVRPARVTLCRRTPMADVPLSWPLPPGFPQFALTVGNW